MEREINLVDMFYSEMAEILTNGKPKHSTPISTFAKKNVDALMKKASEYTSLPALEKLDGLVHQTQEWIDSKTIQDIDFSKYLINRELFGWQKNFVEDRSKKITARMGRRSGKSYALMARAVHHCLEGMDRVGTADKIRRVIIIGLTQQKCKDVFWFNLCDLIKKCKVPVAKIDNSALKITFANGASIELYGNSSKNERDKLRGQEYSLIIIDECQSQSGFRYLIDDILQPIAIGRDSTMIMAGTGSLVPGTYWDDITIGDGASQWQHYYATMEDNPTIADHEHALHRVLEDNGWTEDNATYRREYLAETAIDSERFILPIRHYYDKLPNVVFTHACIGVDYGYSDNTALAPILVAQDGTMYLWREWCKKGQATSDIVNECVDVMNAIYSMGIPKENVKFVADTNAQTDSSEIFKHGVPIVNAYKCEVNSRLKMMSKLMETSLFLIPKDGVLDNEAKRYVWKTDEETHSIVYEPDDDQFHPDLLHAANYALYFIKTKRWSKSAWLEQKL